ncbi:Uu.00g013100.m01.CDS01 [Anthostomella pinea]|uniref:Uu.00g013100.m01.CDS01 n=1 Tax=Anthostomella pinea TaxID=933095 RepID=A0AAI8YQB9_9PEZI|nr:Uu.00g013100.m01.CDS01 [Anthostomella pinea]
MEESDGQNTFRLRSIYEGTGDWPKVNDPIRGAVQQSWSTIGFPKDRRLTLDDYENRTHIDNDNLVILELAKDIVDIQQKPANEIADARAFKSHEEHERVIETFRLHNRSVAKIRIRDCNAFDGGGPYSKCKIAKAIKEAMDKGADSPGPPPSVAVEQMVATRILLARGGEIEGRTSDYWRKAIDLAQQELYLDPELQNKTRQEIIDDSGDATFKLMLRVVKESIKIQTPNPYHQSRRDQYAVDHGIFYHVKDTDIVMVLDKVDNVIAFQMRDAFRTLLPGGIDKAVAKSFETYSTFYLLQIKTVRTGITGSRGSYRLGSTKEATSF